MMPAHATLEQLSGLLDAELEPRQQRRVEVHLEECEECRVRLAGLETVVGELARLRQQAPPAHLGALVRSGVRRLSNQPRLRDRLERVAGRFTQPPGLLPAFGVVLALGAILYLFSLGVAKRERGSGTQVIFESAIDDAAEAAADGDRRDAAGRPFAFVDGVWIERGLPRNEPDRVLAAGAVPAAEPELAAAVEKLRGLRPAVRFLYGDEVVEVRFSPPAPR